MPAGDQYRVKAARFRSMAEQTASEPLRQQYESLAAGYLDLANLADKNAQTDLSYETPEPSPARGPGL